MQGVHEQRTVLDIPDGAATGDLGRQRGAGILGGDALVGHRHDQAEASRRIDAACDGGIAGRDGDTAEHAGGDVVGVALDGRGAQDQARGVQLVAAQDIGGGQRRDDRGGRRAAPGAERDVVADLDREVVATLVELGQ